MKLCVMVLLVAALPASAQDLSGYNRALSAFNGGDFEAAAAAFFDVMENSTDADLKRKSEYYLAQSLLKRGLPLSALGYFAGIVRAGKSHPNYLKSVEGVVTVQEQLNDQELVPRLLNEQYNDDWAILPLEVLSRINFLIGRFSLRQNKLEEAKGFFEAVPPEGSVFPAAQYLLGITLVDPRFPGGPKPEEAIKVFMNVVNLKDEKQRGLAATKQLATLAIGRTYYGQEEYARASEWYEKIPRFSKFWDESLFENGFARFQNDDLGGSLGALQALHAPQFAGAFQPESWILKATVYYFSCLHTEAKTALAAFDDVYLPMVDKLKPVLEQGGADLSFYYKLIASEDARIPKPVLNGIRNNERMKGMLDLVRHFDEEKATVESIQSWRAGKVGSEIAGYLNQNRANIEGQAAKLAKIRLTDAQKTVKGFANQAEIIRFETSKAEKELAEQGVNQKALLRSQTLYRPKSPAENFQYWKFQGEFWRDEIGYYRYTLKRGCPVANQ